MSDTIEKSSTSTDVHNVPVLDTEDGTVLDMDAKRLAEMGYTQDMGRKFSVISVLGVGFSLTNSWFGVSAGMITGINAGGPVLLVYGVILMFIVSIFIATTLSELSSAFPSAGGQYFWARELAPKKYAKIASYVTGWSNYAGAVFGSASVSLTLAYAIVGCYQLGHPDFVIGTWHVFLAYQLVNAFSFVFNTYGRFLPTIASLSLYCSLLSFLIIFITVPATAPTHQHATFVFATFLNNTGWSSNGVAFITGLININWAFSCLDTALHMAEEVAQPERAIPIAICGTVGLGFLTAFPFILSMMFSLNDFDAIANTATGVPLLELFYQALGNKGGAIFLEALVIATGFGCQIACHTWQSRLCWSFARDGGLPFDRFLARTHPTLDVPLNAHMVSCVWVAALGCLYWASYSAINSIITACIVLPYISYSIPVICLLVKGRDNIRPGPFWTGRFGFVANIVTLCWTVFTLIMYSFPAYMPATADGMNYVSAAYAIIALIVIADWNLRAKKDYRDQTTDGEGFVI